MLLRLLIVDRTRKVKGRNAWHCLVAGSRRCTSGQAAALYWRRSRQLIKPIRPSSSSGPQPQSSGILIQNSASSATQSNRLDVGRWTKSLTAGIAGDSVGVVAFVAGVAGLAVASCSSPAHFSVDDAKAGRSCYCCNCQNAVGFESVAGNGLARGVGNGHPRRLVVLEALCQYGMIQEKLSSSFLCHRSKLTAVFIVTPNLQSRELVLQTWTLLRPTPVASLLETPIDIIPTPLVESFAAATTVGVIQTLVRNTLRAMQI